MTLEDRAAYEVGQYIDLLFADDKRRGVGERAKLVKHFYGALTPAATSLERATIEVAADTHSKVTRAWASIVLIQTRAVAKSLGQDLAITACPTLVKLILKRAVSPPFLAESDAQFECFWRFYQELMGGRANTFGPTRIEGQLWFWNTATAGEPLQVLKALRKIDKQVAVDGPILYKIARKYFPEAATKENIDAFLHVRFSVVAVDNLVWLWTSSGRNRYLNLARKIAAVTDKPIPFDDIHQAAVRYFKKYDMDVSPGQTSVVISTLAGVAPDKLIKSGDLVDLSKLFVGTDRKEMQGFLAACELALYNQLKKDGTSTRGELNKKLFKGNRVAEATSVQMFYSSPILLPIKNDRGGWRLIGA